MTEAPKMSSMSSGLIARLRRAADRCGIAVRRYRSSYLELLLHLARVYLRLKIRPGEALQTGLADPHTPKEALSGCISKRGLMKLQRQVNPESAFSMVEDKSIFYPLCRGMGIPVPMTYAVFGRTSGHAANGAALSHRSDWEAFFSDGLPAEFIVKPATGVYGERVMALNRKSGVFVDSIGRTRSAGELYDLLSSDIKYDRFVIQERLANHPALARLTGSAHLQTLRMTTFVNRDGLADVYYGFLKLIVGNNVSDNFHYGKSGNLIANVALDSGTLGQAMTISPDGVGMAPAPLHPTTGATIAGCCLPFWNETMELARKSARLFHPLRSIGWDIAQTPAGPVVIEGNFYWDPPYVLGPMAPGMTCHGMSRLLDTLRDDPAAPAARWKR
jgi:Sugar-transfer associated ATP-grasp